MESMTVGEAAKAVGVSAKAIRLWESRGLIPPAERTSAGYRTFADSDLVTLRFIRQAKSLGLTLDEIRDIIDVQHAGASPCDRVVQAIDAHLSTIDRSIADLLQLRKILTVARSAAGMACPDERNGVVCHIIERAERR
ncbi:MAG: heavy metal-responsive transcriptional regulator [Thermomicrobiales bacterium]